jgi:serine/threonine protein kinase/tetratricopeptide (TPR) repeat protein
VASEADITTHEWLAEGLLGELHRAEMPATVALKRLTHAHLRDPQTIEQQFGSLVRLDHPNLASYIDWVEDAEVPSFVAELVEGVDLYTYLRRPAQPEELELLAERAQATDQAFDAELEELDDVVDERPDEPDAEEHDASSPPRLTPDDKLDLVFLRLEHVLPQIVAALEHLHRFKKPHGNLKPTNVLVDADGHCTLCDFGLMNLVDAVTEETATDTLTPPDPGEVDYSQSYWPPERQTGSDPTTEGDLFGLGCILFEAITGCRPMQMSELEPRCPAAWVDLVLELLDEDPEERARLDDVMEVLETTRARSVDLPPTFVADQDEFFGREAHLEHLVDQAKACVRAERLHMSLLSSPPGYGKTALAERLGRWAAQRGWIILRGRCFERASLIFQGWDDVVDQILALCKRADDDLDEHVDELRLRASRLFPRLAEGLNPEESEASTTPPDGSRLDAVDAFRRLLRRISQERPLLLLFDDIHWLSRDSARLLCDLLTEPEGLQLYVVATWRPVNAEEDHPLAGRLETAPFSVDRVDVRGFNDEEAVAYVEWAAGQFSRERQQAILEAGQNNPLVLEELSFQQHLNEISEPDLPTAQRFSGADTTGEALRAIVASRLPGLSRQATFLLELLSVADIPLPVPILQHAVDEEFDESRQAGRSVRPVRDTLRRLNRLRLVREVSSNQWDQVYMLYHDVIADIALEEDREVGLSHRIAEALDDLWPDADELRFAYLLRAGRERDAAKPAVRGARRAARRYAYDRAARLWQWLGDHRGLAGPLDGIHPYDEQAGCELRAGRPDTAAEILGELATNAGSDERSALYRTRQFEAYLRAGNRAAALESVEQAMQAFDESYATGRIAARISEWKNRIVAATNRWSDELDDAATTSLEASLRARVGLYLRVIDHNDLLVSSRGTRFRAKLSALSERSGHAWLLAWDRYWLGHACHREDLLRRKDRATEWYDEAEGLFRLADKRIGLARTSIERARLHRADGDFDACTSELERAERSFRRIDDESHEDERYRVGVERGRLELRRGNFEAAELALKKVLHLHSNNQLAVFAARRVLVDLLLWTGRRDEAETLVAACESIEQGELVGAMSAWLGRQHARLNLAMARPDVAVGQLDVHAESLHRAGLLDDTWVRGLLYLSLGQALAGLVTRKRDFQEARTESPQRRLQSAADRLRPMVEDFAPPRRAEIRRFLAKAHLLDDEPETALKVIRRGIADLSAYPSPVDRTLCAEVEARILHQTRQEGADALLEDVYASYDSQGCHLPLVLEGWRVPSRRSELRDDAAE